MKNGLNISNLSVSVDEASILNDVHIDIKPGTIHALMGPNGSGKSTLAMALMGHPSYQIDQGTITLNGNDLTMMPVHKRALSGLFLSFQQPVEVPGVPLASFLKAAYESHHGHITPTHLKEKTLHYFDLLDMDHALFYRNLHEGFSGGQKKKLEMIQLLLIQPHIAILDEIDSGLDIDALQTVAQALKHAQHEQPEIALLVITHYQRILNHIVPDRVHIMSHGTITHSGSAQLAQQVEHEGYEPYMQEC